METKSNEKPPTESGMLSALSRGELQFPPFIVDALNTERRGREARVDAALVLRWGRRKFRFAVSCKALGTPKVFAALLDEAERTARALELSPLVLLPYLSPEHLTELEIRGISGLDLCGNAVVVVPGEVLVLRTGQPNRFRPEGRIKNVYRKNSSIVARAFLIWPEIDSVGEAVGVIGSYGVKISLSTVSKVIAALDSDLVVRREVGPATKPRRVRLLQPEKLLDLLAKNYTPPEITRAFTGKIDLTAEEFRETLRKWQEESGGRIRATGESSVGAYATMPREDLRSFYCSDVAGLLAFLGQDVRETERFANLKLLETGDDFVYFGGTWDGMPQPAPFEASPIQTYLELSAGDKRDRETAEQVRRLILEKVKESAAKDSHGPADPKPPRHPL